MIRVSHGLVVAVIVAFALARPSLAQPARPPAPPPGTAPAPALPPASNDALPAVIPPLLTLPDVTGTIATYQPAGPSAVSENPFFAALGSNGRSCFTCHLPAYGWSFSAGDAQRRFADSNGSDPLFRPVDGAVCPTDSVATPAAMQSAYRLLLNQGLIRVGLSFPSKPQFTVAVVTDQDGCTGNPATGLTSPTSGTVNVYRRPPSSANLAYASTLMWDGRELSLQQQAVSAVLRHEEAAAAPTAEQQEAIAVFESGLLTAQSSDNQAGDLTAARTGGGPVALAQQRFYLGINSPFGLDPTGAPFSRAVFSLYDSWASLSGSDATTLARQSIARGQQIFNTKPVAITGVGGLNDVAGITTIPGSCSTCHSTPNIGNQSAPIFLDIGVAAPNPPVLNVGQLPLFSLTCTSGREAGQRFVVSDPGRAMVTGSCADIGKTKVPSLRALAARAPYFHNGSAQTLVQLVDFYDRRFAIRLNAQEKADLVNFLGAL